MLKKNLSFVALVACVTNFALAQAQNRPFKNLAREHYLGLVHNSEQSAAVSPQVRETLRASYSDSSAPEKVATCASAQCSSGTTAIYAENFTCPAAAQKSCTFDIQIAGEVFSTGVSINAGENGLYQFLIDGLPPNGGGTGAGTDPKGFYSWQFGGPSFLFGTSYNVHSTVTNSSANQQHVILVGLACQDTVSDPNGCFVTTLSQALVVRVWTP